MGAGRPHSHGPISRPYLSTLQPQAGQVQPPHSPCCTEEGLRTNGKRVPQRGQLCAARERPQRPFAFVCCQINPARATRMMRTIIADVMSHSTRTNTVRFRDPPTPYPAALGMPSMPHGLMEEIQPADAERVATSAGG